MTLAVCRRPLAASFIVATLFAGSLAAAPVPDSERLAKAKDFIADEQWNRAVEELRKAADDPKEPNRDEALFWLAHSQHQAGDQAGAVETIARLERTFPASRWVRPARSLRVEIAQQLNRDDLLWHFAVPPPPPSPPPAPASPGVAPAAPAPATPPARPAWPAPAARAVPTPLPPAPPVPPAWLPEAYVPDVDVRIQALGSLIQAHPDRVIPLLKEIALDPANTVEARRAVLVLAQSGSPKAELTVLELARQASEPVRIAAIREMGRFDDSKVTAELLQVYPTSTPRVKRQIVSSLGVRADAPALLRIARTEADPLVRNIAIVTLGRAGTREQLRALYAQASPDARAAVLTALFTARDDEELIRIATLEKSAELRAQARRNLQLLGTPRAVEFLSKKPEK